MARLSLFATAALALCATLVSGQFVNTKVVRNIDATKSYLQTKISITATATQRVEEYILALPKQEASTTNITVQWTADASDGDSDKSSKTTLGYLQVTPAEDRNGFATYRVRLASALSAEESVSLRVVAVTTDIMTPLPEEISQTETQFMKFTTNAYLVSPYLTKKQVTNVKLASSNVLEYSKSPAPASQDGSKIKYGPYSDIEAFTAAEVTIHYENQSPFATFTSVTREVEISLWGNVAVEEHYDLANTGAKLKHGFSRVDMQLKGARGNSFNILVASLPPSASDIYYRDVIGNISSSAVRKEIQRTAFEIVPRFPLFGGWKTVWYQGYNVPASDYITVNSDGSYTLTFDAYLPFTDIPTRKYRLRIVLPEAATLVSANIPFPHSAQAAKRFTYLDGPLYGRHIVDVHANGVLLSSGNVPAQIQVTFTVPPGILWCKPVYVVTAFFVAFVAFVAASRLNFSLSGRKGAATAPASKVHHE